VTVDVTATHNGPAGFDQFTNSCTVTQCSVRTPIAYPMTAVFDVDATGGRVRGLSWLRKQDPADNTYAGLYGIVSYTTSGHANPLMGSGHHLVQGNLAARMLTISTVNGRSTTQTAHAPASTKVILDVGTRGTSQQTRGGSAGNVYQSFSGIGTVADTQSVNEAFLTDDDFANDFELTVQYIVNLDLHDDATWAEADFSHTFQFEDVRFLDADGIDVTANYDLTFDDPDFYLASRHAATLPEPPTSGLLLLGLGLLGTAVGRRKRTGPR
jgi:hypothetical protein